MCGWHKEAFASYTEECEEVQEHEAVNTELRNKLSEAASASSSSPTFATTKVFSGKKNPTLMYLHGPKSMTWSYARPT